MLPIKTISLLTALIALLLGPIANAQTTQDTRAGMDPEWRDITKWIPPTANAILAIDAKAMFQSELAIRNDWRESHAESFDRNPTMLPPPTDRFVLSTEVDVEHFEPSREVAVIATSSPVPFDEIQKRVDGNLDTIAGLPSIHTDRDSYVIPIDQQHVVLVRQASRQWAAQQLRDGHDRVQFKLAPVLEYAVEQVAGGTSQIVVAVDLTDAISRSAMRGAIRQSGVLEAQNGIADTMVDEMMHLKGLVFSVDIATEMNGTLEMIFQTEPKQLTTVAKPVMLELLAVAGAVLPEFKDWQAVPRPDRLTLQGELTIAGMRRVLSLLSVESVGLDQEAFPVVTEATRKPIFTPEQIKRRATANYAKRITRLADAVVAGGKGNNLREQVLWTDRSAKAITRMSTRNVDYDAVQLGRRIAYGMFGIVSAYQEADQRARSRIASENPPPIRWHTEMIPYRTFVTPHGRFYRYRPYSYAQVFTEENAIHSRQIVSQELVIAHEDAKELVTIIERDVIRLDPFL